MARPGLPYKTALITGARSGLGAALARRLVAEGCHVWGTSREPAHINVPGVTPLGLDLARPEQVEQFIRHTLPSIGEVDLLVNNAGYAAFGYLEQQTSADIQEQLMVMLTGPILLARAVLPGMLERRRGCIVNVASLAARFPIPCMAPYNSSKAALSAFSRSLIEELRGTGVQVLDFQPGDFKTQFNRNALRRGGDAAVWATMEKEMANAPECEAIVEGLMRPLRSGKSGTVACGGFFQARLAPLGQKLLPTGLFSVLQRFYFRTRNRA